MDPTEAMTIQNYHHVVTCLGTGCWQWLDNHWESEWRSVSKALDLRQVIRLYSHKSGGAGWNAATSRHAIEALGQNSRYLGSRHESLNMGWVIDKTASWVVGFVLGKSANSLGLLRYGWL